jgi:hypothetical protein
LPDGVFSTPETETRRRADGSTDKLIGTRAYVIYRFTLQIKFVTTYRNSQQTHKNQIMIHLHLKISIWNCMERLWNLLIAVLKQTSIDLYVSL